MKRDIMKKFDDAEEALATVDRLEYTINQRGSAVHFPELIDNYINGRDRKVLRRKVRSVGSTKLRGSKMWGS